MFDDSGWNARKPSRFRTAYCRCPASASSSPRRLSCFRSVSRNLSAAGPAGSQLRLRSRWKCPGM
ncbi:hypothetical protein EYF80_051109 [Liparis tanakae]|uniref:Uncharacterized protein n=1 Tax=Liparis tanakae TaxID=230148 RepID=A0A4Z2FC26_9TELE|nr:hypothetical protein EYF80_051109 [Liparis tanakae]